MSVGYKVQFYARIGRVRALLLLRSLLAFSIDRSADAGELNWARESPALACAPGTSYK
jgi:hypothetical protein